jgi:hypothetical protein
VEGVEDGEEPAPIAGVPRPVEHLGPRRAADRGGKGLEQPEELRIAGSQVVDHDQPLTGEPRPVRSPGRQRAVAAGQRGVVLELEFGRLLVHWREDERAANKVGRIAAGIVAEQPIRLPAH